MPTAMHVSTSALRLGVEKQVTKIHVINVPMLACLKAGWHAEGQSGFPSG